MPTVSIIVPVYNAEKYLSRCINSILSQIYKDFELILIDDGSTDSSGSICDNFAKKDNRIIVRHIENGGVSSARNLALSIASGQWIMFCDSDDYVDSNWCELMLSIAIEKPYSFIVSNVWRVQRDEQKEKINKQKNDCESYYDIFKVGLSGFPVNKIYNIELLNKGNILFEENCPLGEDVAFNCSYCELCESIEYIDQPLYYYCDNESCATKKYYPDLLGLNLKCFSARLKLINDNEIEDFCDYYLSYLTPMLENVFDERCNLSLLSKLKYNDKIIKSTEFKFCVEHSTGANESPKYFKLLKKGNYYLLYLVKLLTSLKKRG